MPLRGLRARRVDATVPEIPSRRRHERPLDARAARPGRFFAAFQESSAGAIGMAMRLRLCTWNVNSVRLRVEHVARFVADQAPDVLCLQEIKCREGEFPKDAFADMGLPNLKI